MKKPEVGDLWHWHEYENEFFGIFIESINDRLIVEWFGTNSYGPKAGLREEYAISDIDFWCLSGKCSVY